MKKRKKRPYLVYLTNVRSKSDGKWEHDFWLRVLAYSEDGAIDAAKNGFGRHYTFEVAKVEEI